MYLKDEEDNDMRNRFLDYRIVSAVLITQTELMNFLYSKADLFRIEYGGIPLWLKGYNSFNVTYTFSLPEVGKDYEVTVRILCHTGSTITILLGSVVNRNFLHAFIEELIDRGGIAIQNIYLDFSDVKVNQIIYLSLNNH